MSAFKVVGHTLTAAAGTTSAARLSASALWVRRAVVKHNGTVTNLLLGNYDDGSFPIVLEPGDEYDLAAPNGFRFDLSTWGTKDAGGATAHEVIVLYWAEV